MQICRKTEIGDRTEGGRRRVLFFGEEEARTWYSIFHHIICVCVYVGVLHVLFFLRWAYIVLVRRRMLRCMCLLGGCVCVCVCAMCALEGILQCQNRMEWQMVRQHPRAHIVTSPHLVYPFSTIIFYTFWMVKLAGIRSFNIISIFRRHFEMWKLWVIL